MNPAPVDQTRRSYSHLAPDYDRKRFAGRNGRFVADRDQEILRTFVGLARPVRLLDTPVGTGRALSYVGDGPRMRVGLDYTPEMLAFAARVQPRPTGLLRGDAAALPFKDGAFDCVISLRFFHLFHEPQRAAFAREFIRVLAPGGHLIVSFTNGWYAGGLNWLRQQLGARTVQFESRGELQRLFPGCTVIRRHGNFLPKQWLVDGVPLLGPALRRLTEHPPVNRICWEHIYLLRRP